MKYVRYDCNHSPKQPQPKRKNIDLKKKLWGVTVSKLKKVTFRSFKKKGA